MSLKPETIVQIQTMLQTDSELLAQIQSITQPTDAAEVIAKAATAKGIEVSAAEMAAHFESAAAQGAMSDAELEQVAGGVPSRLELEMGIMSVFTLGIGCAIASVAYAARFNDCGGAFGKKGDTDKMVIVHDLQRPWP